MDKTLSEINRKISSFRTFRSRLKKKNNTRKMEEMDKRIRVLAIDRTIIKLQQERERLLRELGMTEEEVYRSGSAIEIAKKYSKKDVRS